MQTPPCSDPSLFRPLPVQTPPCSDPSLFRPLHVQTPPCSDPSLFRPLPVQTTPCSDPSLCPCLNQRLIIGRQRLFPGRQRLIPGRAAQAVECSRRKHTRWEHTSRRPPMRTAFPLLVSQADLAPLSGAAYDIDNSAGGEVSVSFISGDATAAQSVEWSLACDQSVQLVALMGARGGGVGSSGTTSAAAAASAAAPTAVHIDVASGRCRVTIPAIPEPTTSAPATVEPPTTEKSYDITGMGAGPFESLINAAPASRGSSFAWSMCTAIAVILSTVGCRHRLL